MKGDVGAKPPARGSTPVPRPQPSDYRYTILDFGLGKLCAAMVSICGLPRPLFQSVSFLRAVIIPGHFAPLVMILLPQTGTMNIKICIRIAVNAKFLAVENHQFLAPIVTHICCD